jgi:hypothetical protein
VAIELLAGVTAAERERWDAVGQVRLEQKGGTTTVLFARLPESQQARVRAFADTGELVDMWGRAETIEARGGYFVVDLPGALCMQTIADYCMIGGTTYYLIQEIEEGQSAEEHLPSDEVSQLSNASPTPRPSPPATPSPTLTLSPTVAPSPTLMPSPPPTPSAAPTGVPTVMATSETAAATVEAPGDGKTTLPAYSGLVVLGLGLALGAGLAVWVFGRRGG